MDDILKTLVWRLWWRKEKEITDSFHDKNFLQSTQYSAFSYLKSYSNVPYKYTSVYGNSIVDTIKVVPNTESELIHKFPSLIRTTKPHIIILLKCD